MKTHTQSRHKAALSLMSISTRVADDLGSGHSSLKKFAIHSIAIGAAGHSAAT